MCIGCTQTATEHQGTASQLACCSAPLCRHAFLTSIPDSSPATHLRCVLINASLCRPQCTAHLHGVLCDILSGCCVAAVSRAHEGLHWPAGHPQGHIISLQRQTVFGKGARVCLVQASPKLCSSAHAMPRRTSGSTQEVTCRKNTVQHGNAAVFMTLAGPVAHLSISS